MLIGLRNAMMAGKRLSAKSYVQDGLIAMWDGIENAGWGVHDPNATVWKDLVGTLDLTYNMSNCTIGSDHLVTNGQAAKSFESISYSNVLMTECVFQDLNSGSSRHVLFCAGSDGGGSSNLMTRSLARESSYFLLSHSRGISFESGIIQMSIQWSNASYPSSMYPVRLYKNAIATTILQNINGIGIDRKYVSIGSSSSGNYGSQEKIYNLRLYNRALIADEIAANYAVDKARFNLPDAT